jgi:ABC-2 type transport system ATP-binding protein
MEEADKLSDRVGIIDYGKIVALDTPVNLKENLQGDVITIKTKDSQKLSEILAKDMNLQNARIMDDNLELTAPKGKALLPKIVDMASHNKITVDAISVREPSLEDVFLYYTGREIRAEGGSELHGVAAIKRRAIK